MSQCSQPRSLFSWPKIQKRLRRTSLCSGLHNRLMACSRVIHADGDLVVEIVVRCEGERVASQALELIAGPCAALVGRTLARLPEASPRTGSGDSAAWEVVTIEPTRGEDEAPAPRPLRDHAGNAENCARARAAGVAAKAKIAGHTAVVPATPPHPQNAKNRYYVVLVGRPEVEHARGVYPRWNSGHRGAVGARAAVYDPAGTVCEAAVFHGFPTMGEIDAYCAGAGEERPRMRA